MRVPSHLQVGILLTMCIAVINSRRQCKDTSHVCHKIGRSRPASRCYRKHVANQCCDTCRRLRDFTWPGCEYGDTQEWCSSIGDRYALSSCYGNQDICCRTCPKLRLHIPGCPYGDRVLWCRHIGKFYSPVQCQGHGNETCCQTCHTISSENMANVTTQMNVNISTATTAPNTADQESLTSTPILGSFANISQGSNSTTGARIVPGAMATSRPGLYLSQGPTTTTRSSPQTPITTNLLLETMTNKTEDPSLVNKPRTENPIPPNPSIAHLGNITVALDTKNGSKISNISTVHFGDNTLADPFVNHTEARGSASGVVYKYEGIEGEDYVPGGSSIDIDSIQQLNIPTNEDRGETGDRDSNGRVEPPEGTTDDEDFFSSGDDYWDYEDDLPRYHHKDRKHKKSHGDSAFKLKGWLGKEGSSDYMYYDLHSCATTLLPSHAVQEIIIISVLLLAIHL